MMKTDTKFTYDNYHSIRSIGVFDSTVENLIFINHDFKRYIRMLKENNINTTIDLATTYITCSLSSYCSLRKKFFELLKDFPGHHITYNKQMYDELQKQSEGQNQ